MLLALSVAAADNASGGNAESSYSTFQPRSHVLLSTPNTTPPFASKQYTLPYQLEVKALPIMHQALIVVARPSTVFGGWEKPARPPPIISAHCHWFQTHHLPSPLAVRPGSHQNRLTCPSESRRPPSLAHGSVSRLALFATVQGACGLHRQHPWRR